MKLNSALALLGIVVALIALISFKHLTNEGGHQYTIGILQTASFPALDAARLGFINKINKELPGQVSFVVQNAQGSTQTAQSIAASFKANKSIDAYYAIATPALLALQSIIHDKPILFSAVTDPEGLLGPRSNAPNVTGSTDRINVEKQIELLRELLPNLTKVGILYSPAEPNSSILASRMKEQLSSAKIDYEAVGINSQADIPAAVQKVIQNSKIILIPTDNTLAVSLPLIAQIAAKANVPIVISWVDEGNPVPLIQFGVDYQQSGEQAAEQTLRILKGESKPEEISYATPNDKVIINKDSFEK